MVNDFMDSTRICDSKYVSNVMWLLGSKRL